MTLDLDSLSEHRWKVVRGLEQQESPTSCLELSAVEPFPEAPSLDQSLRIQNRTQHHQKVVLARSTQRSHLEMGVVQKS
jgi:hypothetical protein